MHFVSLIASERKKGNSDCLGRLALKEALKNGADSGELLYLSDFKIYECQGCMECVFKGKLCKLDDDLYELLGKIRDADVLILIAPTYILSVPGSLKLLLDRYLTMPAYFGYTMDKSAVSIGIASLPDWHQFQLPIMNLLLLCMGFRVMDSFIAYGAGQGEVLLGDGVSKLKKSIEKLCRDRKITPFRSQLSNHCPVDFSTLFERMEDETYRCPVCLTPCERRGNGFYFKAEDLNSHRWLLQNVRDHFDNWILKTKDRFKKNLREIQKKKRELSIDVD